MLGSGFLAKPLPGVRLEFLDWKERLESDLRAQIESAASVAWRSARDAEAWDAARDAAEALYLLQSRGERDYEQVIEARAKSGRLLAAEVAYADYLQQLDGEESNDRVESLMERVRAIARSQDFALATAEVPFVGREDELKRLRRAVDRVSDGEFTVAIVSGESGIGKSRLLAEVRRLATLDGIRCLTAQPVELEKRISLNPILDALSGLDLEPHLTKMGEPWRTVVGAMLPSSSPSATRVPPPPIDETALSRRLLDAFSLLLHSLAEEEPTILFIDDLQWVDATTVAVLEFYGRRYADARFGVFVTVRPELVSDDDPVAGFKANRASIAPTIVRLGDLPTEEAERLVHLASEGSLPGALVSRLFHLAGRHPLFLIELAREAATDHQIAWDAAPGGFPLPISIREIVSGRTRRLSGIGLRVVRLLSAGSQRLTLQRISSLLKVHADTVAAVVDELQQRRLVDIVDYQIGPVSPMIARAVYSDTPQPVKTALHRWWAIQLQREPEQQNEAELATHLDRAGDRGAAEIAWRVATRYRDQGAASEAAHFYELASRNESDPTRRALAFEGLGAALLSLRDLDRAVPALLESTTAFRSNGDLRRSRRSELRMLSALGYSRKVSGVDLVKRLEQLRSEAELESDLEAQGLAMDVKLETAFRSGDAQGAEDALRHLDHLLPQADAKTATVCHTGLAMKVLFGDPSEGLSSARLAVEMSASAPSHRGKALVRLMVALLVRGQLETAEGVAVVRDAQAIASRTGDRRLRYIVESNLAIGLLDAGELDRAEAGFERAKDSVGGVYPGMDTFNWAYNRGELDLARGDYQSARAWFEQSERQLGSNAPDFVSVLVDAAAGLSALGTGDLAESRRREARLPSRIPAWCFDPTTLVSFRTTLLDRRGKHTLADDLLAETRDRSVCRFELTWLKLSLLHAERLRQQGRKDEGLRVVEECLPVARSCCLTQRTSQLESLQRRLSGTS